MRGIGKMYIEFKEKDRQRKNGSPA
jgi:hypothetical protein